MSDKQRTSEIGATRLGVLAIGVMVLGLGAGAFVSYLDANPTGPGDSTRSGPASEESRDNEQDRADRSRDNAEQSTANSESTEPTAENQHASDKKPRSEEDRATVETGGERARLEQNTGKKAQKTKEQAESKKSAQIDREETTKSTPANSEADESASDNNDAKAKQRSNETAAPRTAGTESPPVVSPEVLDSAAEQASTSTDKTRHDTAGDRGGRRIENNVVIAAGSDDDKGGGKAGDSDNGEFTAENVARRIQKFYKKTEDFKAEFKQVYRDIAAGEKKVRWGKVYFKTPGKMRWDYYENEKLADRTKTLVSDGDYLWIYELEFQQVFKECLSEKQLPTSLKFLMGQGNLLDDFEVSFTDDSSRESPELELVPKEPTPKYKKLHFKVDSDAQQVTETTVFDPYGNTNTIHFSNVKLNSNLPDSGFEFEPPEDARLIRKNVECE